MFAKYHYLSHSHNNAADVYYCTVNDEIAGFFSVLPFPHPKIKRARRGHRVVIRPDFQGIGLSGVLRDYVADIYKQQGYRFFSKTSHPALIMLLKKSKKWVAKSKGRASRGSNSGAVHSKKVKGSTSSARITVSFEYIGNSNR